MSKSLFKASDEASSQLTVDTSQQGTTEASPNKSRQRRMSKGADVLRSSFSSSHLVADPSQHQEPCRSLSQNQRRMTYGSNPRNSVSSSHLLADSAQQCTESCPSRSRLRRKTHGGNVDSKSVSCGHLFTDSYEQGTESGPSRARLRHVPRGTVGSTSHISLELSIGHSDCMRTSSQQSDSDHPRTESRATVGRLFGCSRTPSKWRKTRSQRNVHEEERLQGPALARRRFRKAGLAVLAIVRLKSAQTALPETTNDGLPADQLLYRYKRGSGAVTSALPQQGRGRWTRRCFGQRHGPRKAPGPSGLGLYVKYSSRSGEEVLRFETHEIRLLQTLLVGLQTLLECRPHTSLRPETRRWLRRVFRAADRENSATINGDQLLKLLEAANIILRKDVVEDKLRLLELPMVLSLNDSHLAYCHVQKLIEDLRIEQQYIGGLFRQYSRMVNEMMVMTLDDWLRFSRSEQVLRSSLHLSALSTQFLKPAHADAKLSRKFSCRPGHPLPLQHHLLQSELLAIASPETLRQSHLHRPVSAIRLRPCFSPEQRSTNDKRARDDFEVAILASEDHASSGAMRGLSIGMFQDLLLSKANSAVDAELLVFDESKLDSPCTHYWINCSHNSFLDGHQLTSRSAPAMFRRILLDGCRSVEIDCWDGADGEPEVTHGNTLTTSCKLRDVLQAINETAFETSKLPVTISMEMHCSRQGGQQVKTANLFRSTFGARLLMPEELNCIKMEEVTPRWLFGRVIVKGKMSQTTHMLLGVSADGDVDDVDDPDEHDDNEEHDADGDGHDVRERDASTQASRVAKARTRPELACRPPSSLTASKSSEGPYDGTGKETGWIKSFKGRSAECPSSKRDSRFSKLQSFRSRDSKWSLGGGSFKGSLRCSESSRRSQQRVSESFKHRPRDSLHGEFGALKHDSMESSGSNLKTSPDVSTRFSGARNSFVADSFRVVTTPNQRRSTVKTGIFERKKKARFVDSAMEDVTTYRSKPVSWFLHDTSSFDWPMPITSLSEGQIIDLVGDSNDVASSLGRVQKCTLKRMAREYPRGTRITSTNVDPLIGWRAGVQMIALNQQTNDLPMQLNRALFQQCGGCGFVLKPPGLRVDPPLWPPERQYVRRTTLRLLSLHHLPVKKEQRPNFANEPHHAEVPKLSGVSEPPSSGGVLSPALAVELHSIGGFCCISSHSTPPDGDMSNTRFQTPTVTSNGLNPTWGVTVYCLTAEPETTFLKVIVLDGDAEIAYEVVVIGLLRPGYRCLQLRSKFGTPIDLCYVMLHISIEECDNPWVTVIPQHRLHLRRNAIKSPDTWSMRELANQEPRDGSSKPHHRSKSEVHKLGGLIPILHDHDGETSPSKMPRRSKRRAISCIDCSGRTPSANASVEGVFDPFEA